MSTILFLALLACSPTPPEAPPAAPKSAEVAPRTHAMLLVIDTLRADALARAKTPFLDELARSGSSSHRAWSPGTWTVPSVISMMSGMPVRQHGWDLPTGRIGRYPPIPQVPTLATVLRAKGFATAGLYANSYLAEEIGFDRGFDSWHRTGDSGMAKAVRDEVGGWSDGRRHFLYVHIMGPHSPLDPSEVARERWKVDPAWLDDRGALSIGIAKRDQQPGAREAYRAAYHAVVEDTDLLVSEIVHALGSLTADTMLVVTSDHGELLGEHGTVGHGSWVWEPLTGVPLIAVGGPRLPRATSTTVIPDVITRGLGVPHAWPTSVEAPLPLVAQREGKLALSADGRTKAVWNGAEPVVFDLEADPLEMRPIPGRGPAMTPAREAWEARTPAGTASNTSVALHPDTVEALRAMGYLADPPATAAGE